MLIVWLAQAALSVFGTAYRQNDVLTSELARECGWWLVRYIQYVSSLGEARPLRSWKSAWQSPYLDLASFVGCATRLVEISHNLLILVIVIQQTALLSGYSVGIVNS